MCFVSVSRMISDWTSFLGPLEEIEELVEGYDPGKEDSHARAYEPEAPGSE